MTLILTSIHFFFQIADPEAWGYQPLSSTQPSFLPIKHLTEDDPEPFTLTLIGQGELKIPTELEHVVVIRHGLPYWDFYRVMMSMSIVVPAFGNPDCEYSTHRHHNTFLIETHFKTMTCKPVQQLRCLFSAMYVFVWN